MEEKLVTFKTAKLAKEKRFNWPTYWYCSYKRKCATSSNTFYPEISQKPINWNDTIGLNVYDRASLPTQSLLQKWLREIHHIYVTVIPSYNNDKVIKDEFFFEIAKGGKIMQFGHKYGYFDTHEETLEIGLFEGLNLIK